MAFVCVILNPCSASRAAPACTSFSNSTKAISWRPGTRRTSLKPGNLQRQHKLSSNYDVHMRRCKNNALILTGWRAWRAWVHLFPQAGWWGRGYDWVDFLQPARRKWRSGSKHQDYDIQLYFWDKNSLPAEAFVQASSDQEVWHLEASDQVPYLEEASCLEGACKVAGLECASYVELGSLEAFPEEITQCIHFRANKIFSTRSSSYICPQNTDDLSPNLGSPFILVD